MTLIRRLMRLAAHGLIFELNIYKSLLRWLLRRPSIPTGFEPVGYAQLATPMMALWIFGSALELPLVHVLVPWHRPRIALLVIGAWGLLWMLGALAAVSGRVNLHLALRDRIQLSTKKGDIAITGLSLWVDEPREAALRIRSHVDAGSPRS